MTCGCSRKQTTRPENNKNEVERLLSVLTSDPELSTVVSLIQKFNLLTTIIQLLENGGYGLTLPTNAAFSQIDTSSLSEDDVKKVLLYHVHKENNDGLLQCALNGQSVAESNDKVNDANVLRRRDFGKNHLSVIDRVLLPPKCN
jgi:uncharacterized surface protein with fasciclin (FAS1) repeats